uniref:Uncharacterized protein n=1 Tax=Arundo donax TaxID=35708 RepID=A0A0A8ZK86_ARUDO
MDYNIDLFYSYYYRNIGI